MDQQNLNENTNTKHAEEGSESLIYLKNSFQQHMERQHGDKGNNGSSSSKEALFEAIHNFNKQELATEYERSLIRLFNMYCRHVFWSLIQRENEIESIFSMILESPKEMRAFATFLKVLGNECFITGNKVYIKAYKTFLKKVVQACSGPDNKFRPFLSILLNESLINAYQVNLIEDLRNDQQQYSQRRVEDFFKTESKASQLMNPYIIVPLLRLILANDPTVFEPYADRLVSILLSVNCLFVGNFKLKEQTFELVVSILEHIRKRVPLMNQSVVKRLLTLKVVETLFSPREFEDQRHHEREEVEYVKRMLKDNSGSKEIDGITRRDTERLVYAKRAQVMQTYIKFSNKDSVQVLIEMLYKLYQIDKGLSESIFKYKNNLMNHFDVYSTIIEQGKDGKLNEQLLFINHKLPIDDKHDSKIMTTTYESNHKEFDGVFSSHYTVDPTIKKVLIKVNHNSELRPGAALLITSDKEGTNVLALFNETQLKKEMAFENLYHTSFYVHYPVYPHFLYQLAINEGDSVTPNLIDQPLYQPLERFEEHSSGKFFVTKGGKKMFIWKNDELKRYKDHLTEEGLTQITFGKQCRILLFKSGKVWGEGRNKGKHLVDQDNEVADVKGVEIPFFEKKDKLVKLSSFFQVTIGVSEKGKVFAVGDKLAKTCKIDNNKFGFFEIPLGEIQPPKKEIIPVRKVEEGKPVPPVEMEPASKPEKPDQEVKQPDAIVAQAALDEVKVEAKDQSVEQKPLAFLDEVLLAEQPAEQKGEILAFDGSQEIIPPYVPGELNVAVEEVQIQIIAQIQEQAKQPELEVKLEIVPEIKPEDASNGMVQQNIPQAQEIVPGQLSEEVPVPVIVPDEVKQEVPVAQAATIEEAGVPVLPVPQPEQQEAPKPAEIAPVQLVEQEKEEEKHDEKEEEHKEAEVSPQIAIPESPAAQIEEQVEIIDTTEVKPVEGHTLFALNAWCCKSSNTGDFVYLVLVYNSYTEKTELRSLGHSQYGNLGQGPDVKDSPVFRPVDLLVEIRSNDDVYIGYDYTFVVGKDENVYAWGSYTNEDKYQFRPVLLTYFKTNNYIVQRITGYQRTCALVSPKEDLSKKLLVFGKCAPFVGEDQMRVLDLTKHFSNVSIFNIQSLGDKLLISTEGTYNYKKPLSQQAFTKLGKVHSQKCEKCLSQIQGLLHFNKNDEGYHYFCHTCVSTTDKLPEQMWAIKRPIKDLETKTWPILDLSTLENPDGVESPVYLTRVKINDKEIEKQSTLKELLEDSLDDINPIIYVRLNKPLKEGTKLDLIKLEDFYPQSTFAGLSFSVTPDYTFSQSGEQLATKNQELYDQFRKCFTDVEALEDPLQKEFRLKIEEYVTKLMKDVSGLHELKLKEIKISEETLKFSNEKLTELSEECKRIHLGRYLQYLQYVWGSFTYVYRGISNGQYSQDFSLLSIYNQNKHKIPLALKNKILRRLTDNLSQDDSTVSIHVNRKRAKEFFDSGKIDEKGEHTVFAQVYRGLSARTYQGMRINSADKKAWFVKFIGEFALDQGGLFRESLTELCQELQSPVLNLLIPTQNQKNLMGESRDKWTLNPAATSPSHFKMLEFLGTLIGMSVRSGILMSLQLPTFFWKQLTEEDLTTEDLKEIDSMTVNIMNDLQNVDSSQETINALYDELNFTTILSNGEEVELVHGGKHKQVNKDNFKDFIVKTLNARFNECKKQIKAIKKGIDITFDSKYLRLLSWRDLEYKVVGKDIIDIERLKEITAYRNCTESHDVVKKLWKILNSITNEEKTLYLKFVWGRTRLPLKEEEITENHTIQIDEHADMNHLPIGRTCFFRLEIPAYKSEDVFRDKLLYSIRHCTAIDADIEGAVHNEEENVIPISQQRMDSERSRRNNDNDEDNEGGDNGDGGAGMFEDDDNEDDDNNNEGQDNADDY